MKNKRGSCIPARASGEPVSVRTGAAKQSGRRHRRGIYPEQRPGRPGKDIN
ncbi:MAG: hypothetical protein LBS79_03980 [Tannerella sp.]|nr:hypothetical protein [Tannerella sp.]